MNIIRPMPLALIQLNTYHCITVLTVFRDFEKFSENFQKIFLNSNFSVISKPFCINPDALESCDAVQSIYDEKTSFPGSQSDQSEPITTLAKTCLNLSKLV